MASGGPHSEMWMRKGERRRIGDNGEVGSSDMSGDVRDRAFGPFYSGDVWHSWISHWDFGETYFLICTSHLPCAEIYKPPFSDTKTSSDLFPSSWSPNPYQAAFLPLQNSIKHRFSQLVSTPYLASTSWNQVTYSTTGHQTEPPSSIGIHAQVTHVS